MLILYAASKLCVFQPRWDSWGRLTQPAFSQRLLMGLHGNHEVLPPNPSHAPLCIPNWYSVPITAGRSFAHLLLSHLGICDGDWLAT